MIIDMAQDDIEAAISRVKSGIEALDEYFEGGDRDWRAEIDLGGFNFADPDRCVLGQLFGDFAVGIDTLGVDSRRYGFDCYLREVRLVESLWRSYLTGVPLTVNDMEVKW